MEKAQQRLHRKLRRITSLSRLGFDLTEVPEDIKGDTSMGKGRGDIISLALEYVQAGLSSDNWISVSNSKDSEEELWSQPVFSTAPAVVEDRLYTPPPSTFHLDYFQANILLAYAITMNKYKKSRPLRCSESKIHLAATFSAGFFIYVGGWRCGARDSHKIPGCGICFQRFRG